MLPRATLETVLSGPLPLTRRRRWPTHAAAQLRDTDIPAPLGLRLAAHQQHAPQKQSPHATMLPPSGSNGKRMPRAVTALLYGIESRA